MIVTEELQSWIRYLLALGTNVASCALINEYHSPSGVLACDPDALINLGRLSADAARRLRRGDGGKAQEILALCREFGWQVVTPADPLYPASLRALPDFPLVLFARGDPGILANGERAAIVGTRRAGAAGLDFAFRLAASFSENGVCTVSGGAVGIDTAAHEGGLTGPGSTVAVLGNGFGFNYLPEQVFLRRRIEKYGLLLTETLPFQGPGAYSFQRRNRIISALAGSVVVAESGKKGGSLITADFACKQRKRLFVPPQSAVPSPGCAALRAAGASELTDPAAAVSDAAAKRYRQPAVPLLQRQPLPPFLDPAALTPELFALHNETTPAEALPVYRMHPVRRPAPETPPQPSPDAAAGETRDLFSRVADAGAAARSSPPADAEKPAPVKKDGKRKQPEKTVPAETVPEGPPLPADIGETERRVAAALTETPVLLDDLAASLGMESAALMNAVSLLELTGHARVHPGGRVSRP